MHFVGLNSGRNALFAKKNFLKKSPPNFAIFEHKKNKVCVQHIFFFLCVQRTCLLFFCLVSRALSTLFSKNTF